MSLSVIICVIYDCIICIALLSLVKGCKDGICIIFTFKVASCFLLRKLHTPTCFQEIAQLNPFVYTTIAIEVTFCKCRLSSWMVFAFIILKKTDTFIKVFQTAKIDCLTCVILWYCCIWITCFLIWHFTVKVGHKHHTV